MAIMFYKKEKRKMNALNIRNKRITLNDVQNIFNSAGIHEKPKTIQYYQQAFTHKSYVIDAQFVNQKKIQSNIVPLQKKSYETLEFYGDSIIAAATVEYLYKRFPEFEEGDLTKLKNKVVSANYLSKFGSFYKFSQFILLSNTIENIYGRDTDKILEDVFEAFVAAISHDIGFMNAKKFMQNSLDRLVNFSIILYINENYKDRILNYFQVQGWNHPKYEIDVQLGPQNKKSFVVNLMMNYKNKNGQHVKKIVCKGIGKTKKMAEMNASYNALELFQLLEKHEILQ